MRLEIVEKLLGSRNNNSQRPQRIQKYVRVLAVCSDEEDGGFMGL